MRRGRRWGFAAAVLAGVVGLAGAAATIGDDASAAARGPIIIGWAFDGNGQMAPFDGPALAAAKIRVAQINARGGVNRRRIVLRTCNTQNNNPARARSCAASLLGGGAHIVFTTCDVDFATPVVQETINRGKLAVAP